MPIIKQLMRSFRGDALAPIAMSRDWRMGALGVFCKTLSAAGEIQNRLIVVVALRSLDVVY
jgi:hypothetical protein